jgi:hypothetical protein
MGNWGGGLQLSGGPIGGQGRSGKVQVGYDGRSTTKVARSAVAAVPVGGQALALALGVGGSTAGRCAAKKRWKADSLSSRPNRETRGLQLRRFWPCFVSSNVAAS